VIRAAIVAALVLSAGAARAETGVVNFDTAPFDSCIETRVALPLVIPANVAGIPILAPSDRVTASLVEFDGSEFPTRLVPDERAPANFSILTFEKPLEPGKNYTLKWDDTCSGMRTQTFRVEVAAPLPTLAGTVAAGAVRRDPFKGRCDEQGRPVINMYRSVVFLPSEELTPFLGVASVDFTVVGKGTTPAAGWGDFTSASSIGEIPQSCPSAPTKTVVVARVHLPAGPTISTVSTEIELACPAIDEPLSCGEPEASSAAPPASADDTEAPAYGCATSSAASGGVEVVLIALALALGARSKRRM
jgi:hypothetical protein